VFKVSWIDLVCRKKLVLKKKKTKKNKKTKTKQKVVGFVSAILIWLPLFIKMLSKTQVVT